MIYKEQNKATYNETSFYERVRPRSLSKVGKQYELIITRRTEMQLFSRARPHRARVGEH